MRILIADDDPISRGILERLLQEWGHETICVNDGIQAWVALHREDRPSIAILDWLMPGMDGIKVCRNLRQEANGNYVYMLILTGRSQRKDLLQAFAAGADDFISKPFEPAELQARVKVGARILDLEAELIASREKLRVEATHDSLTGAWNRGAVLGFLEQELARAKRDGTSVATVLFDLDHFKLINDRNGHPAGDATLKDFVLRLKAAVRTYDAVGRYGGEEFLAVLPNCSTVNAVHLTDRIIAAVSGDPVTHRGAEIRMTVSAGISSTEGDSDRSSDDLLHEADLALYRAKRGGRNRAEVELRQSAARGGISRVPIPSPKFTRISIEQ